MALQKLPSKKISEVFIICPGFTVDCLETLEEINTENREIFLKNGVVILIDKSSIQVSNASFEYVIVVLNLVKNRSYSRSRICVDTLVKQAI